MDSLLVVAFVDAAERLVDARRGLSVGKTLDSGSRAFHAIHGLLSVLVPADRSHRGTRAYKFRECRAVTQFGVRPADFQRLRKARGLDRYYEEEWGGEKRRLTAVEAEEAVHAGLRIFRRLLEVALPAEKERAVRNAVQPVLARLNDPGPEERLLDIVERCVGWGQYDSPGLESHLLALEVDFSLRDTRTAQLQWARVLTLRAHLAMNRGCVRGNTGSLELAQRALGVWERYRIAPRVIHTLKIISISSRSIGIVKRSLRYVRQAEAWADGDQRLLDSVDSEKARVQVLFGAFDTATKLVRGMYDRAESVGGEDGKGRLLQALGKVYLASGDLARAEWALERGQGLVPHNYAIAQCVGANALCELHARRGNKQDAHFWASQVQKLAHENGFEHQERVLGDTKFRYRHIL